MSISKEIPGGEILLLEVGTYTGKDGKIHPSPAKVGFRFSGQEKFTFMRCDQFKKILEELKVNKDFQKHVGVTA